MAPLLVASDWTAPPGYYSVRPPQGKETLRRLVRPKDRFDIEMAELSTSGDGTMKEKATTYKSDL